MSTPVTIDYIYGAEVSKNVLTGLNKTTFSYQRTFFDVNRHVDVITLVKNFLSITNGDDWERTVMFVSTSARHSVAPWNEEVNYLNEFWAHNKFHIVLGSSAGGDSIKVSVGRMKWTGYDQVNEAIQSGEMLEAIKNTDFRDCY